MYKKKLARMYFKQFKAGLISYDEFSKRINELKKKSNKC